MGELGLGEFLRQIDLGMVEEGAEHNRKALTF